MHGQYPGAMPHARASAGRSCELRAPRDPVLGYIRSSTQSARRITTSNLRVGARRMYITHQSVVRVVEYPEKRPSGFLRLAAGHARSSAKPSLCNQHPDTQRPCRPFEMSGTQAAISVRAKQLREQTTGLALQGKHVAQRMQEISASSSRFLKS